MLKRMRTWRKIDKMAKKGVPRLDVKRHEVARIGIPLSNTSTTVGSIEPLSNTSTIVRVVESYQKDKTYAAWDAWMIVEDAKRMHPSNALVNRWIAWEAE